MKLTYPVKIGDRLWPAGTEVRQATLEEVRKVFPAIGICSTSTTVAVWLPGMEHPTLVHQKQVTGAQP